MDKFNQHVSWLYIYEKSYHYIIKTYGTATRQCIGVVDFEMGDGNLFFFCWRDARNLENEQKIAMFL
jgi:hypothetical protein